jgi:hypothetical protein
LYSLARRTFAQVIEATYNSQSPSPGIECKSNIAKIRIRHVLQLW